MTVLKTVKKCPNCGSLNIMPDWTLKGTFYRCNDCNWRGAFILEEDIEN